MEKDANVIYHGATVIQEPGSGQGNPPPYPGPQAPGPNNQQSGPYVQQPGPYVQQGPYVAPQNVQYGTAVTGTVVVPLVLTPQMGPNPTSITCKSCNCDIITRTETKASMRTHLFAALLCLVGCWPCACVPYCMDSCNNTEHYCPNCNAYIGSYLN